MTIAGAIQIHGVSMLGHFGLCLPSCNALGLAMSCICGFSPQLADLLE
jgi:hypothetical protein